MANEIRLAITLSVTKGALVEDETRTKNIDMTGDNMSSRAQSIGTTEEALDITDMATLGVAYFLNTDATNYIEIGTVVSAVFYPFMKLKPGEMGACRLANPAATTFQAKANTAPVVLKYLILED